MLFGARVSTIFCEKNEAWNQISKILVNSERAVISHYGQSGNWRFSSRRPTPVLARRDFLFRRHFFTGLRSSSSLKEDDDHYRTLGVARGATADEIKAAFFELTKLYHPDVSKSESCLDDFLKIRAAYEVLSDARKKREYDTTMKKMEKVVDDMFPEGWKEQERKKRERRKAEEEMGTAEKFKEVKRRYRQAEEEYNAHWAQDAKDMHPAKHEALIWWLKFKQMAIDFFRGHPTEFKIVGLALLLKIVYDSYLNWKRPNGTIKADRFNCDADKSYAEWLQSQLSERLEWKENVDRLPEMLDEKRQKENLENMERYKKRESETPD